MKCSKGLRKILSIILVFVFLSSQCGFAQAAGELNLSSYLSSSFNSLKPVSDSFRPLQLKYFSYNTLNNQFQALLDKGDLKNPLPQEIESNSKELLKYFLIGVTLPDKSFWVNLRPDASDNIIDPQLAKTDFGKILLEADVQLKKDTARYTSPQTPEGRIYWDKLYKKAGEIFGQADVTIPTLVRPWIVPNEIIVREAQDSAYIYKATLKVLLEEDYLKTSQLNDPGLNNYQFNDPRLKALNEYSAQLIRELIIPKLNKEINASKRYAALRQVYRSLILARWFKNKFAGQAGAYPALIDQKNLTNLESNISWSKNTYFQQYQESFKKGEYNVSEQVTTMYGRNIRQYFSGGVAMQEGLLPGAASPLNGAFKAVNNRLPQDGIAIAGDARDSRVSLRQAVPVAKAAGRAASPITIDTSVRVPERLRPLSPLMPREKVVERAKEINSWIKKSQEDMLRYYEAPDAEIPNQSIERKEIEDAGLNWDKFSNILISHGWAKITSAKPTIRLTADWNQVKDTIRAALGDEDFAKVKPILENSLWDLARLKEEMGDTIYGPLLAAAAQLVQLVESGQIRPGEVRLRMSEWDPPAVVPTDLDRGLTVPFFALKGDPWQVGHLYLMLQTIVQHKADKVVNFVDNSDPKRKPDLSSLTIRDPISKYIAHLLEPFIQHLEINKEEAGLLDKDGEHVIFRFMQLNQGVKMRNLYMVGSDHRHWQVIKRKPATNIIFKHAIEAAGLDWSGVLGKFNQLDLLEKVDSIQLSLVPRLKLDQIEKNTIEAFGDDFSKIFPLLEEAILGKEERRAPDTVLKLMNNQNSELYGYELGTSPKLAVLFFERIGQPLTEEWMRELHNRSGMQVEVLKIKQPMDTTSTRVRIDNHYWTVHYDVLRIAKAFKLWGFENELVPGTSMAWKEQQETVARDLVTLADQALSADKIQFPQALKAFEGKLNQAFGPAMEKYDRHIMPLLIEVYQQLAMPDAVGRSKIKDKRGRLNAIRNLIIARGHNILEETIPSARASSAVEARETEVIQIRDSLVGKLTANELGVNYLLGGEVALMNLRKITDATELTQFLTVLYMRVTFLGKGPLIKQAQDAVDEALGALKKVRDTASSAVPVSELDQVANLKSELLGQLRQTKVPEYFVRRLADQKSFSSMFLFKDGLAKALFEYIASLLNMDSVQKLQRNIAEREKNPAATAEARLEQDNKGMTHDQLLEVKYVMDAVHIVAGFAESHAIYDPSSGIMAGSWKKLGGGSSSPMIDEDLLPPSDWLIEITQDVTGPVKVETPDQYSKIYDLGDGLSLSVVFMPNEDKSIATLSYPYINDEKRSFRRPLKGDWRDRAWQDIMQELAAIIDNEPEPSPFPSDYLFELTDTSDKLVKVKSSDARSKVYDLDGASLTVVEAGPESKTSQISLTEGEHSLQRKAAGNWKDRGWKDVITELANIVAQEEISRASSPVARSKKEEILEDFNLQIELERWEKALDLINANKGSIFTDEEHRDLTEQLHNAIQEAQSERNPISGGSRRTLSAGRGGEATSQDGWAPIKKTPLDGVDTIPSANRGKGSGRKSSSAVANEPGGIDFTVTPMLIQPVGNFKNMKFSLPRIPNLEGYDIAKELAGIKKLTDSRNIPLTANLKKCLSACYYKGQTDEYINDVIGLLEASLRLQEEYGEEASPEFRELLVLADTI